MPDLTTLIAGELLTLLAFLLIVSGQLYLLHGKVKPMSLIDDVEALFAELKKDVEALIVDKIKPLVHDEVLRLNARIGELEAGADPVLARIKEFVSEEVVAKIAGALEVPGETADPQPTQPAS
jgi:hypothetical protein